MKFYYLTFVKHVKECAIWYAGRLFVNLHFFSKYCLEVRTYKIVRRAEVLGLYMTAKFNINEINVDIRHIYNDKSLLW